MQFLQRCVINKKKKKFQENLDRIGWIFIFWKTQKSTKTCTFRLIRRVVSVLNRPLTLIQYLLVNFPIKFVYEIINESLERRAFNQATRGNLIHVTLKRRRREAQRKRDGDWVNMKNPFPCLRMCIKCVSLVFCACISSRTRRKIESLSDEVKAQ